MLTAHSVIPARDIARSASAGTITLDRESRYRRRIALTTDQGRAFLLDLPEPTYLNDGDALDLSDGSLVIVRAAAEDLMEVHAPDPLAFARIAWHLGNRHTPAEITPAAIYIRPDHVLAAMLEGLGAHVHRVMRPFDPEGGAYGHKGALAQGHHHGHGHDHGHHHGDGHGYSHD